MRLAALALLAACERGTPTDCAQVADTLAALQLGNYATAEQRAPVLAAMRDACERAHVTNAQAACLLRAETKFAAAKCAPRVLPDVHLADRCADVVDRIRTTMHARVAQVGNAAQMEKTYRAMTESCEQDGWPASLQDCVLATTDVAGLERCSAQMPADVERRMQARLR